MRILEFCNRRRFMGSGITEFAMIKQHLAQRYGLKVDAKDIRKSLESLKELGTVQLVGYTNVAVVPVEMTDVVSRLIEMAEKQGRLKPSQAAQFQLSRPEFHEGVSKLLARGLLWEDSKA